MRHKLSPIAGRMLRRRGDLIRLAKWRSAHGVVSNLGNLAWVMADCLAFGRHAVDHESFSDLARRMCVNIPEDTVMEKIHLVSDCMEAKGPNYEPFNSGTAGRMLDLNVIELQEAKVTTMSAVDEFEEQTRARRRENRAATARERDRRRRQAAGARPRAAYEAESASKTKPWEQHGISRAKWYRRQKQGEIGPPAARQVRPHDTTEVRQVPAHDTTKMRQVPAQGETGPRARHNGGETSIPASHSSYREACALVSREDEAAPEFPFFLPFFETYHHHQPAWHAW